jgi:NTP pyrophosphatase (non-canonical NTP hydrolase)
MERDRQDAKWGVQDHTDEHWLVILTEEIGEVARAMFEGDDPGHLDDELTQSAAVIVAWLESRKRRATN